MIYLKYSIYSVLEEYTAHGIPKEILINDEL